MVSKRVKIQKLAVFSCKKRPDVIDGEKLLTSEELKNINRELRDDFQRNIMGSKKDRGIWNSDPGNKKVRIHDFSDESILDTFRNLLNKDENFMENSTALADRYVKTKQSQSAAIFIFKIRVPPNSYIVIYSSQYLGGVLRLSDTKKMIERIKNVFSTGLLKGLIYPYEVDGELNHNSAKVFQNRGPYADYWWKAFGLKEESLGENALIVFLTEYEKETGEKMRLTKESIGEIIQKDGTIANLDIILKCDKVEIQTTFGELHRKVIPVTRDDEKMILAKGKNISVRVGKYGSIEFQDNEGYIDFDELCR
jgi:hypothetical protein